MISIKCVKCGANTEFERIPPGGYTTMCAHCEAPIAFVAQPASQQPHPQRAVVVKRGPFELVAAIGAPLVVSWIIAWMLIDKEWLFGGMTVVLLGWLLLRTWLRIDITDSAIVIRFFMRTVTMPVAAIKYVQGQWVTNPKSMYYQLSLTTDSGSGLTLRGSRDTLARVGSALMAHSVKIQTS